MSELFKLDEQTHTYIGEETSLKGHFTFQGHTLIAGSLEGEVILLGESPLCIESTGSIKGGTIHCHNLKVYGSVHSEIISTGHVTFFPSSLFTGKVRAKNLTILPGSKINMQEDSQALGTAEL